MSEMTTLTPDPRPIRPLLQTPDSQVWARLRVPPVDLRRLLRRRRLRGVQAQPGAGVDFMRTFRPQF
jgi:hypothetical protein